MGLPKYVRTAVAPWSQLSTVFCAARSEGNPIKTTNTRAHLVNTRAQMQAAGWEMRPSGSLRKRRNQRTALCRTPSAAQAFVFRKENKKTVRVDSYEEKSVNKDKSFVLIRGGQQDVGRGHRPEELEQGQAACTTGCYGLRAVRASRLRIVTAESHSCGDVRTHG